MTRAIAIIASLGLIQTVVGEAVIPDTIADRTLDEVVVTGSNAEMGRSLLPYTVSTIGNKQIEATGSTQLLSAISGMVPSLFVSERNIFGFGISNGGSGGIKIRGVGGNPTNAVLMMVDGQPQFAGIYSHHVADYYQSEYVDRVEVLRGPGSVLYGSNAMGGVINVITKDARHQGVKTTLTSQYGSYNTWLSSLTNTVRHGRFSSLISLGYDRTDGVKKNFDFNQFNAYAKVVYDISDRWRTAADYTVMRFVGNDPVYPTLSNPGSTDIYHQKVIRGEASVSLTNNYGNTNGVARAYYSYGNHFVDDPRHFHSVDDRLGILLYENFRSWNGANATVGFDFDRYSGKIPMSGGNPHTAGSLSTMPRRYILEYSPYVTLSQSLASDLLTLNAGLRMSNSNRFGCNWIPQAGLTLQPATGWFIKASTAKGYRNPSFRELYLYQTANPELLPEKMINYEVSLNHTFNRYIGFDITSYFSRGSDMIQVVDRKNVNTGRFINKGIEVSIKSHPCDRVTIWSTYSYLHSSLTNLNAAPRNQYYLGLGWDAFKHFHVDAELKGAGGLYVSDDIRHQNYATLNMRMTYRVFRILELFVNLDNITATRYVINRGYDMPGFTAMGGFRLTVTK